MDDFALTYLLRRFFYRIFDFLHHWYVDGSRAIAHKFISTLENMDQSFAVAVTLRYLFQPLYKDYTPVGRVLGVIFRIGRIIIGSIVYLVVAFFFLIVYLLWILVPVAIIFSAIRAL